MEKIKRFYISLVTALFGLTFLAWGNLWADSAGTVTVAINTDPSTVNSNQWKTGIDGVVSFPMHNGLYSGNFKGGSYLNLAESLELSPDGLNITVKIKKGAVFHTGDPVTAHDVAFSYEQVLHPKNAAVIASTFDVIDEIEVIDDYTLVFHLYDPKAQWDESLLWLAIHSKKYFEKAGRKKFLKHPVGSGPFRFVERTIGESITYERFDDYFDLNPENSRIRSQAWGTNPKVNFKTLKLMTVTDPMTRTALLETGAVDLIYNIQPHQIKKLKRNPKVRIRRAKNTPSLFGLTFRIDNFPLFKDRNLKKAIDLAINRQEIIDRVYLGEGYPLYMYASRVEPGYDPDFGKDSEYNPSKAEALVKKSSYRQGTPLTLSYAAGIPQVDLVASLVQLYLKRVGITVKLRKFEYGTFISYSISGNKALGPMGLYSWAGGKDPSFRLQLSISSDSDYCQYRTRPNKKEVDALIEAQAFEINVEKRKKVLAKIHRLIDEDSSGTVLYGLNQIYALSDRIKWAWSERSEEPYSLSAIRLVN